MTSGPHDRSRNGKAVDEFAHAIDPSFRSVAESVTDNIMLLDPEGVVLYINYTVPDLTVEKVLGTSVYQYVPEEYRETMQRCHARVLATGEPDRYETAYASGTDETSWWETRVSPVIRDGRVVALVQISSNVTERKQAAADRDRLFNLSMDMLCVGGTDGYLKRINPAFEHTLGYTSDELLRRPFLEFVHPDDRDATREVVANLAKGEPIVDFENRYLCSDGSYRWLSWRASPDTSGRQIYAIGRDVTERHRLERQLRHSQKMEAVGQLAAGIAHDFNNLVLAIDLNVNLAMRAPNMNKQEQFCNEIKRATQRAADLTRQLLALGRRPRATLVPLDLNVTVRGMLKLLHRLIPESIEIEFLPDAAIPAVSADVGQIEQVVLNLCLNARDAMPEGGKLTIATEAFDDDPLMHRSGGRGVALSIADTGIGMSEKVRDRIFEPFFTTKAPGQGTGLGLATAYAIVEQHGGRLRVDSQPGQGARFEIRLPMTSEVPANASPSHDARSEALRGTETVLVAEDEPGVRSPLAGVLEDAGYRVLVAANGEEAVERFRQNASNIAVVMLDVVMPRLGGPMAAQQIREIRADIPVVFVSGYDQAVELAASTVAGALHLTKPYKPGVLLRTLRQAIDGA